MDEINKVSIIMPAYNSEKYVADAINSVINQTYDNWELLAVDDGSTDSTGKIIDDYAAKDIRIKVVHTENKGVSHARNIGLDRASGDWIAFLDSDDMLMNDALLKLLSASKNKDLVMGNYYEYPEMKQRRFLPNNDFASISEILESKFIGAVWGSLFRREKIKERFQLGLQPGGDTLFFYSQFRYCFNVSMIQDVVYKYRVDNPKSITKTIKHKMKLNFIEELCSILETLLKRDNEEIYYAAVSHYFILYVKAIYSNDELGKEEKEIKIKEALTNKYFQGVPFKKLRLSPNEMRLFSVLKTGDLLLIEKELQFE